MSRATMVQLRGRGIGLLRQGSARIVARNLDLELHDDAWHESCKKVLGSLGAVPRFCV
jgi:hypothetical protein